MKVHTRIIRAILTMTVITSSWLQGQQKSSVPVNDEDIVVTSLTEMPYPLGARLTPATEGVVVVRVKLDDEGRVMSSEAISGSRKLIPDCLANVNKWRFRPTPSKEAVVVYEFRMDGVCSRGSHFSFREPNIAVVTGCYFGSSSSPSLSPQ